MIIPSFKDLQVLQKQHEEKTMCPMYIDVMADLNTPVSAFIKLRQDHLPCFLFESVSLGERVSRYSFIGTSTPLLTIATGDGYEYSGDPLTILEDKMKSYNVIDIPELSSLPMTGGAVGYCAFEAIRHFEPSVEPYIEKQKDVLGIPESMYMVYDTVIVFDHAFQTIKIVTHCALTTNDLQREYERACDKLIQIKRKIEGPIKTETHRSIHHDARMEDWKTLDECSNVGQEGYMQFVMKLKEHIVQGDIFQAVPSHRLNVPLPTNVSSFDLYRQMRTINPSPYMYFLDMGKGIEILGASPEMLVKVGVDRTMETHPIAGTRHRGKNNAEDEALAADLLADEKERAEHIMLVDLGRNDLGRVAAIGSVQVPSLMRIEKYSHVSYIIRSFLSNNDILLGHAHCVGSHRYFARR